MPEPAIAARRGFFGKLPARGDFVQAGLPRDFTTPWEAWLQDGLASSQASLGAGWVEAWLEAPIWCFALAAGLCGAAAVLGVWMPSVDQVGRHYPLTLASLTPPHQPPEEGFLDLATRAGLAALERDVAPDDLFARLHAADEGPMPVPITIPARGCRWWTTGAPRVRAAEHDLSALPAPERFSFLLADAP